MKTEKKTAAKDYLLGLRWRTFSEYPQQASDIYIHLESVGGAVHQFARIKCFNAVLFNLQEITNKINPNLEWKATWLPTSEINTKR